MNKHGLTSAHVPILFLAKSTGNNIKPAEIARITLREPHSVSTLLDRMERDGLIKKVKDLKSRNQIRVTLTEKGEKAYRQCMPPESIRKIFSALSDSQKEQLGESLDQLRTRALKELHIDYMETFTGFQGNNRPERR